MVEFNGRGGRRRAGFQIVEPPPEARLDAGPEIGRAHVVDHELEPRAGPRQPVAEVLAPDVDDRPQHRQRRLARHPDAEVVGQARPGGEAAADLDREPRPPIAQDAEKGDAVDLRGVALVRAGGDRDLVLARQVGVLAVGEEELRGLGDDAAHVEELVLGQAGERAAGDVAHVVAAGAGGGQAGGGQGGEHLRQLLHGEPVELHVLPRRQLAVAAAVARRDVADGAQLLWRQDAARQLHPQHEVAELRLVVVEPVPLQADEVLLGHRLVAGGDHRRQVGDHREPPLLVLQALDEVALAHQVPGDVSGVWSARRQNVLLPLPPAAERSGRATVMAG